MANNLWSKNSDHEFEDNHPGCMWGILRVLDYHYWHSNVKKVQPHKKKDRRRYAKRNGTSKTSLNVHNSGEVERLLDAEASQFHVDQSSTKTSSTNKRSLRACKNTSRDEEMSKEEDCKQWGSGFQSGSQLQRTYSIHHLEPSDYDLGEIGTKRKYPNDAGNSATRLQDQGQIKAKEKQVACNENFDVDHCKNAVHYMERNQLAENRTLFPEKCDKAKDTLGQKLMEAKQLSGNVSHYPFKEYEDILEIFKVNKELFLKILQNADDGIASCFQSLKASNRQPRLTKSGSFPVADLSCSRSFKPSKLKHKQNEIWSFLKGEKLLAGTQAPKLVSVSLKDLHLKSGPLMASDSGGNVLNQEKIFSCLASTQALDKKSSEVVIGLLKEIKQRMEHAIDEGKNESNFTSLDALLGPSTGGKGVSERLKDSTIGRDNRDSSSCHEIDGSVLSKDTLIGIKRTSSLNESMDRYARLFDYSLSREAKWPCSKSLKLANEYEIPSGRHDSISFRRIHSLPHLDSCCSLQNEVSHDARLAAMSLPILSIVDRGTNTESDSHDEPKPLSLPVSTDKHILLNADDGIECLNNMVERTDGSSRMEYLATLTMGINDETVKKDTLSEEMDELAVGESSSYQEQEITPAGLPEPSSVLVLQSCFQENATIPAEFPFSEGSECTHNCFEEKESSVNSQKRSETESLSCSCSTLKPEDYRHTELYAKDDADFNYVREILERAGFITNSFLGTWHLSDQPLNPSVFEAVEVCWPHELECSMEDIWGCCHHLLLFDLVNEVLLEMYDRSFTYYPKSLSFSCHIRPVPVGYRVLEEVWSNISRYICLKQELEHPLDRVVAQDMAKDDGWMNLQLETECVALELEDLIFDELLDEFIYSRDC